MRICVRVGSRIICYRVPLPFPWPPWPWPGPRPDPPDPWPWLELGGRPEEAPWSRDMSILAGVAQLAELSEGPLRERLMETVRNSTKELSRELPEGIELEFGELEGS